MILKLDAPPVAATISVAEAASQSWDAIVLGAGPAGSMAARGLALRGVRTLLVDKADFPRPKVCGCCLGGLALDVLHQAGLGDVCTSLDAIASKHLELSAFGRRCVLPLPEGAVVSREALDAELIRRAAAAGAAFLPGVSGTVLEGLEPGGRSVQLIASPHAASERDDRLTGRGRDAPITVSTRVVVACDGLTGGALRHLAEMHRTIAPSSRIGAGATLECSPAWSQPETVYMFVGDAGYVGMVQLPGGRLDMAASLDVEAVRRMGIGDAVRSIAAQAGHESASLIQQADWRGTPRLTQRLDTVAVRGVFAVGDAAGYVEPFTGEGIGWALAGGAGVVKSVLLALAGDGEASANDWRARHQEMLRTRMRICGLVSQGLRRPWLARTVVRFAATLPAAVRPITACVHRPLPRILTR